MSGLVNSRLAHLRAQSFCSREASPSKAAGRSPCRGRFFAAVSWSCDRALVGAKYMEVAGRMLSRVWAMESRIGTRKVRDLPDEVPVATTVSVPDAMLFTASTWCLYGLVMPVPANTAVTSSCTQSGQSPVTACRCGMLSMCVTRSARSPKRVRRSVRADGMRAFSHVPGCA